MVLVNGLQEDLFAVKGVMPVISHVRSIEGKQMPLIISDGGTAKGDPGRVLKMLMVEGLCNGNVSGISKTKRGSLMGQDITRDDLEGTQLSLLYKVAATIPDKELRRRLRIVLDEGVSCFSVFRRDSESSENSNSPASRSPLCSLLSQPRPSHHSSRLGPHRLPSSALLMVASNRSFSPVPPQLLASLLKVRLLLQEFYDLWGDVLEIPVSAKVMASQTTDDDDDKDDLGFQYSAPHPSFSSSLHSTVLLDSNPAFTGYRVGLPSSSLSLSSYSISLVQYPDSDWKVCPRSYGWRLQSDG
ncbi:hypothetical protein NE237_004343 [Protea cynaroides]|uniref:Uncharacterized protein n=1 Tax=Protea cynaroides TaxID=273540 RepID=A0A9Q0KJA2_9MAGN|nr:hypothetical protein NE237_004343 [Protea cynaroides]